MFFKVKNIDVYGSTIYSTEEIIKVSGIKVDNNLVALGSSEIEETIEKKLPYIQNVTIKKSLPSTVEIICEPAKVIGTIEADNGNYLISLEGKILEKVKELPKNSAKVKGIKPKNVQIAQSLEEDSSMKLVNEIYKMLDADIAQKLNVIDVSDEINITLMYRNRITIKLGSRADLEKKLKFVATIIEDPNKINSDDVGIIYATDAKRISFLRKGSYQEMIEQLQKEEEEQKNQNSESSNIAQTETEDNTSSGTSSTSSQNTSSKKPD
jgi:cell division protein FtsQ